MPLPHVLVAVFIAIIWGLNFVFIKIALHDLPPITLGALRFWLAALPAVFFFPRPKVRWTLLAGYGITIFALQFGFLFSGMRLGMSAALSSMITQVQVFFTMALSALFLREPPTPVKLLGAVIAFSGVAMVGLHASQDVNLLGLAMVLCGAFSWSMGNIIAKKIGAVNALAITVWGSLIAAPLLTLFAFITEGPELIFYSAAHAKAPALLGVAYIVYISTHTGYSLWSWLLNRHSANTVAPFALLVPIFGFLGAAVFLGEEIPAWKVYAAFLVVGGLVVNIYGPKLLRR